MTLSVNEIFNWVFSVIGLAFTYYLMRKNNTVHIAVRDKQNKIHKVKIYSTDSEEEVMKKVEIYMKKNK